MATYCTAVGSRALALAALDNKLFTDKGQLQDILSSTVDGDDTVITIAATAGKPVGVCVIRDGAIQAYVDQSHRNQLIGSRLVEISKARWDGDPRQLTGKVGANLSMSLKFWRKNKIICDDVCADEQSAYRKTEWDPTHETETV